MPRLLGHKARPVQSPLEIYLRDIKETPLLKAEEERALAYRIEQGDSEARDHLVCANLRLVVNIARGRIVNSLSLQDLIAEGNLGLLRAADDFDPAMNTRFSTYATCLIKHSMNQAYVNTAKIIRVPAYMVKLMSQWRWAAIKLQDELGRPPTEEEIGASLNLPKRMLGILKKTIRVYHSAPQSGQTDSDWSLDEALVDGSARTPDAEMVEADDLWQIRDLLSKMDQREATVLRLRFGLSHEEPMTLMVIGERLGLTRERIRQIEKGALGKLRAQLELA